MTQRASIGWAGLCAFFLAVPATLHADPPAEEEAPIALMVDLGSGQTLHARESARRFLPASITKVMTAYCAFEMLAGGTLRADQKFIVSDAIHRDWSGRGSTMFLQRGAEVSVDELLRGITTVSANDGSVMLATEAAGSVEAWVSLMNRTAGELGMDDSHFGTPNGWPDEGRTFTTAHDLALLAEAMVTRHPELYSRYFGHRSYRYDGRTQANHDPISGVVPGADGIKTGFTREAGNNFLGSATRDGRRLVMVVAGVESEDERARVARDYIAWGFEHFENRTLFTEGASVGEAQVQGGAERHVPLRTARPVLASLPKGGEGEIALTLHYRGPIEAPIAAGDRIAELEVQVEGFSPYRVPLQAAEGVARADPWQRLVNGVLGFLT